MDKSRSTEITAAEVLNVIGKITQKTAQEISNCQINDLYSWYINDSVRYLKYYKLWQIKTRNETGDMGKSWVGGIPSSIKTECGEMAD